MRERLHVCACVRVCGYPSSHTGGQSHARANAHLNGALARPAKITCLTGQPRKTWFLASAWDAYDIQNSYQILYETVFVLKISIMIPSDISIALAGFYNFAANTYEASWSASGKVATHGTSGRASQVLVYNRNDILVRYIIQLHSAMQCVSFIIQGGSCTKTLARTHTQRHVHTYIYRHAYTVIDRETDECGSETNPKDTEKQTAYPVSLGSIKDLGFRDIMDASREPKS